MSTAELRDVEGVVCKSCGRAPEPVEGPHDQPGRFVSPCAGWGGGTCEGDPIRKHDHGYDEWWCGPCWDEFTGADEAHQAFDVVHVVGWKP